ncbi:MAG: signal peptidase II [Candidatus Moranbacteria bacterium]|nr:signal peptidase II [Candidatus Moranbacteria bacterium]
MPFFILLILIDQASKYMVRHGGGFYICNPGIAFGIKINTVVFYVSWILIISILIIWTNLKFKTSNPKQFQNTNILNSKRFWGLDFEHFDLFRIWNLEFGILLILSGALSNILDRLYFGCVIDFIKLPLWPFFNLADAFITIGVIISVVNIKISKP